MAYVPPNLRGNHAQHAASSSEPDRQDDKPQPSPAGENPFLHVDDIHEHFWPPPAALLDTTNENAKDVAIAPCSPRLLRSHGTLNASASDPHTLRYIVLFADANPRWESERIIFVKSNLELLPGGGEVVKYFENEGKPREKEIEQALQRAGLGHPDRSEHGCRGEKVGACSDIRLEEGQASENGGDAGFDAKGNTGDTFIDPEGGTAGAEGTEKATESGVTEAMKAANIHDGRREAETANIVPKTETTGAKNHLSTADKKDNIAGVGAEAGDVDGKPVHGDNEEVYTEAIDGDAKPGPSLQPSNETIAAHPPVVLFTQSRSAGVDGDRNKGFSYFSHARLSSVEYIPPMSERLLGIMGQKFGDTKRRDREAWKKTWGYVWAVVKLDPVEGVGDKPEVKQVKRVKRVHHGRVNGDRGWARGGGGGGGGWRARGGNGRGRGNWGNWDRGRGGERDGKGVHQLLREMRGDAGGSREECKNSTPGDPKGL